MFDPFNYQCYYPNHIQIVGDYQFTNEYKKYFANTFPKKKENRSDINMQMNENTKSNSINTKDNDKKDAKMNNKEIHDFNVEINGKEIWDTKMIVSENSGKSNKSLENVKDLKRSKFRSKTENSSCRCSIF